MREGAYARAAAQSPGGIIRSSTIGHQGLSKRTAAQLRRTYNLPAPGQQPTGQSRSTTPTNPYPAPRTSAQPAQPAIVEGAPQANPGSAANVNPNSNLGRYRGRMLSDVREKATSYNDPLAQAYGVLRQIDTDAGLQQALRKGYQAQLNARVTGNKNYRNDPYVTLFNHFRNATSLNNNGIDHHQWGHSMQQGALDNAWQD